jgi:hypothetical protein
MAKRSLVHCRICKKAIDRDNEPENEIWISTSRNFYYHTNCYNTWVKNKNLSPAESHQTDEEYESYIKEYIYRDLKMDANWAKITQQLKSYTSNKYNYTMKGIFFTLKYAYEVKKASVAKSEGGIGIIPYLYKDATIYWAEQYEKEHTIFDQIIQQMKDRENRESITVTRKQANTKKFVMPWNELEGLEDEYKE